MTELVPDSWKLIAKTHFGGIAAKQDAKETENISKRVKIFE